MKNILMVESSPMKGDSVTRKITRKVEARLRAAYPDAAIVYRDLAQAAPPHLSENVIRGFRSPGGEAVRLSDNLIDELLGADLVVIASPMWNFGVPSALKAWIDHVVRAGKTFSYSDKGPVGFAKGKKAILITSAGGVYSAGPMASMDFVEPYLRAVLNFIGIEDIQSVHAEGVGIPAMMEGAIAAAQRAVDSLALPVLSLAGAPSSLPLP